MPIRGKDFTLDSTKLEKEYQLVELSEWIDYNTKEKLGFHYTVILPKLKFEKLKVSVKAEYPIITNEELEQQGQIPVSFENLVTWASVYSGRLSAKAEATKVKKIESK